MDTFSKRMRRACKTMGPPPRTMRQYWTAHRSSLTGSLWSNDAPNDAQSGGATLAKHTWALKEGEKRQIWPRKEATKQKAAPKTETVHHTTQTRYSSAMTSSMGPMLWKLPYVFSNCICKSAYLHFTTRMCPLSPNPVKRWGPHPERRPGLSDN